MNEFPIQESKVQRPELRDSTLRRDRLLDWLHTKIHHRVVFVIAEAGYGKTTLLADFARRTRLRTIWYRLDEEDRDWISVLNYLVAAGRQVQPGFAPTTGALLRDLGSGGPARESIVETFVRELAVFGGSGAVLVLDDYHLVDDAADVRALMREIVTRGPERLTVVFASRRRPTIPLARLRALGELVELTADDLRFDDAETERLFRESYGTPLEPDVLVDLNRRTEGWAASLQLVQAAIRDRSTAEIRAFVRGLSGAQAELHDYLAEEVVGELEPGLLSFLMTTSILQSVDPDLATVVTGSDEDTVLEHATAADALGLLPDGARRRPGHRYHPLVRDFLEARLRREVGADGVRQLHRRVARHAEGRSWRLAAHHYTAAGDLADLRRVLSSSTRSILGTGEFALAETYIDRLPADDVDPSFDMIRSRTELHHDRVQNALEHARAAFAAFPPDSRDPNAHLALANLASVEYSSGNMEAAHELAALLLGRSEDELTGALGMGMLLILSSSTDGNLEDHMRFLEDMAVTQSREGHDHYVGVARINLANAARARALPDRALNEANAAIEALSGSSRSFELAAALTVKSWALAHLGRWTEALAEADRALGATQGSARLEAILEVADIHAWYGDGVLARQLLDNVADLGGADSDVWRVRSAQNLIRMGRLDEADATIGLATLGSLTAECAHKARHLTVRAQLALSRGQPEATERAREALQHARHTRADLWANVDFLLLAASVGPTELGAAVESVAASDPSLLSLVAEELVERLGNLDPPAVELLLAEARRRPERWRPALRNVLASGSRETRIRAARHLDQVGTVDDIGPLRAAGRSLGQRKEDVELGRGLARRLAAHVFVEDQGRITVRVGDRSVAGTDIRRKVLALLCFLLTQPDLAASRDQVLDALWPDVEPEIGANSLNQTVYFLRRVFEPIYRDDLSPGYLHHDSDVLWLDAELVDSRSRLCRRLIRRSGSARNPADVEAVSENYVGRFALDFAYEEWASPYRESLHAAYLDLMEQSIHADTSLGHFGRAIALARRVTEVDVEAQHLELALLRLYKLTGAHSAAAEQYEHYSAMIREDLGIDPPSLADV